MLNGILGTGKTVTAKVLANETGLPVLLIPHAYNGLNTFLSYIQQDIVVLIDEYEKVYAGEEDEENDSSLLSLMDGTFTNSYRKIFILTTNNTWINKNMLNRPGRILYKKEFSNLNREQILEIVDDCLVEKQFRNETIDFMKPLSIITVDIVKNIVREINIHQESPFTCCKDLNIEFKDDEYQITLINQNGEERVLEEKVSTGVVNDFTTRARISVKRSRGLYIDNMNFHIVDKAEKDTEKFKVYDVENGKVEDWFWIRFDKHKHVHESFSGAF